MRPIDADAACRKCSENWDECPAENPCGCIIHNAPTLALDDLRPHGRWRKECVAGFNKVFCTVFVCSECEGRYSVPFMKYCPACGAKMDLEEGEA